MDFKNDDFETIALSIKTPKAPKVPKGDRFQHVAFTSVQIQQLAQLTQMPVYEALLLLIEGEVEKSETDHFRAYLDPEKFTRLGLIAVANRIQFERIQKEMQHLYAEYEGSLEEGKLEQELAAISPEEMMKRSVEGL